MKFTMIMGVLMIAFGVLAIAGLTQMADLHFDSKSYLEEKRLANEAWKRGWDKIYVPITSGTLTITGGHGGQASGSGGNLTIAGGAGGRAYTLPPSDGKEGEVLVEDRNTGKLRWEKGWKKQEDEGTK